VTHGVEDGSSVVEIIKEYPSDEVLKRLMLFLETNVGNSGFIVWFLICLHDALQDTKLGQIDVSGLYKSILSKALEAFKMFSNHCLSQHAQRNLRTVLFGPAVVFNYALDSPGTNKNMNSGSCVAAASDTYGDKSLQGSREKATEAVAKILT